MRVTLQDAISLNLKPAGYGSRCLAYIMDLAIRYFFIGSILLIIYYFNQDSKLFDSIPNILPTEEGQSRINFDSFSNFKISLVILFAFIVEWSYAVFFEVYREGVTPGKKLIGLRVVSKEGLRVNFTSSAIRNVLLLVDNLPFFGVVALFSTMSNSHRQRIGDIAAGTLVVYEEKPSTISALQKNENALEIDADLHHRLGRYLDGREHFFKSHKSVLQHSFLSELQPLIEQIGIESSSYHSDDEFLIEIFKQSKPKRTLRE